MYKSLTPKSGEALKQKIKVLKKRSRRSTKDKMGFDQALIAKKVEMSPANLSGVLNGKRQITLEALREIARNSCMLDSEIIFLFSVDWIQEHFKQQKANQYQSISLKDLFELTKNALRTNVDLAKIEALFFALSKQEDIVKSGREKSLFLSLFGAYWAYKDQPFYAITCWEAAIEFPSIEDGWWIKCRGNIGQELIRLGKYKKGIEHIESALYSESDLDEQVETRLLLYYIEGNILYSDFDNLNPKTLMEYKDELSSCSQRIEDQEANHARLLGLLQLLSILNVALERARSRFMSRKEFEKKGWQEASIVEAGLLELDQLLEKASTKQSDEWRFPTAMLHIFKAQAMLCIEPYLSQQELNYEPPISDRESISKTLDAAENLAEEHRLLSILKEVGRLRQTLSERIDSQTIPTEANKEKEKKMKKNTIQMGIPTVLIALAVAFGCIQNTSHQRTVTTIQKTQAYVANDNPIVQLKTKGTIGSVFVDNPIVRKRTRLADNPIVNKKIQLANNPIVKKTLLRQLADNPIVKARDAARKLADNPIVKSQSQNIKLADNPIVKCRRRKFLKTNSLLSTFLIEWS